MRAILYIKGCGTTVETEVQVARRDDGMQGPPLEIAVEDNGTVYTGKLFGVAERIAYYDEVSAAELVG